MIDLPVRSGAAEHRTRAGPTIWFHTFGCRANQYDTERMRQEPEPGRARTVSRPGEADALVVNTCTVGHQPGGHGGTPERIAGVTGDYLRTRIDGPAAPGDRFRSIPRLRDRELAAR